jgi:hypothetical protein
MPRLHEKQIKQQALPLNLALQFGIHEAYVKVQGTPVDLEGLHKTLNLAEKQLLFFNKHVVASVICVVVGVVCSRLLCCCCRRCCRHRRQDNSNFKWKLMLWRQTYEFFLLVIASRVSGFLHNLLEVVSPFLLGKWKSSVVSLRVGPAVLDTLSGELCMELWRKLDLDSKLGSQVLKGHFFIFEVTAASH